jgi:hypothetical protein
MERIDRGRISVALIGGEHRAKTVCGRKNQLGKIGSTRLRNLRGEHIFKYVRELTQLVKSAGGGIALQGMHGAADTANDFFVSGARLELEPCFVERLEQFAGALKEERAQFATAIFGQTSHERTSLRW